MKKELLMGNISKNYIYTLFFNLNLIRGLWMIYLAGKGFSLLQLGLFEGSYHLASFLFEVPTGAVADLWGRKASRICGRVLFISSLLIMFAAETFFMQMAGFILCAAGYNLESGAGEALVYDSMLFTGNKGKYKIVAGRQEFLLQSGFIISYLAGGYLASHSYPAVFAISILCASFSLFVAFSFVEPLSGRQNFAPLFSMKNLFSSMYSQAHDSVMIIKNRPKIAFLIVFTEVIFTFIVCLFFFLQNYWKNKGIPESKIGTVFAIAAFFSGMTAFRAHKIEKIIGEKGVLLFTPPMLLLCLWGIALTQLKPLFYILTGIIEGILFVAVSDYINRLIPSENRATVLSFQSMAFSFFMIVFFPVTGWIGENHSLDVSFIFLSVTGTVLTVFYLLIFRFVVERTA